MSQSDDDALLLLDDGELDPVVAILERSGIGYRRLRGGEIGEDLAPPRSLLITTPRHTSKVRPGSPQGALAGRPVRIVAVQEDSPSLRRMLRSQGFHLLIRQPAHEAVWRLSIQRALFQGDERREETRLPVGAQIEIDGEAAGETGKTRRPSILLDISNRGCHFIDDTPFPLDARVSFELPASASGSAPLQLRGEIIRCGPWNFGGETRHSCAMMFDEDLDEESRVGLARMINAKISGPFSLAGPAPEALSLPKADSAALPGLELDDETDPPVRTSVPVDLELGRDAGLGEASSERRKERRGDYKQRIEVEHDGATTILMGRDLSATGMRVERFADARIGAHLDLALYGPSESEPIPIDAEIVRDDGEHGVALRFCNLPREHAQQLERFIACLPAVESLEDPEAAGMGTVLTEVRTGDR